MTIRFIFTCFLVAFASALYCEPDNCYDLLQVSRSATGEEVKKAFRTMARRHHPDKNQAEDTTQLFQKINLAYEILDNQFTRKSYDYFLQDPSGSRAFHTYQYYRASYSPQVNPFVAIIGFLGLISWLQWVMRKQMYRSMVDSIVNSQDFKKKVNERCFQDGRKGDKAYKEQVAEEMEQDICIKGGHSYPEIKDLVIFKTVLLPLTIAVGIKNTVRWIFKYYILRQEYTVDDQMQLTRKVLKLTKAQWEAWPIENKQKQVSKKLWIRENMLKEQQMRKGQYLQWLKENNPGKYRKVMSFLKKQQ